MKLNFFRTFLKLESIGGILLMIAAVAAVVIENSAFRGSYERFLEYPLTVGFGSFALSKTIVHWVNDGLMVLFFFLVGLEIKREVLEGQLSSFSQAALPGFAAVGGMLFPALIFCWFNWHDPIALHGWAIPAATDIAFALGVLSLLGKRIPLSLKVFLTALAIMDDLGAILIIAFFYSEQLDVTMLLLGVIPFAIMILANLMGVFRSYVYLILGIFLWYFILKSGIHATIAGVLAALCIPLRGKGARGYDLYHAMEKKLHPWIVFGVLPLFAFTNAGVNLEGMSVSNLLTPIPLGIAAGLFFGKLLGIFSFSLISIKLGLSRLPEGSRWSQLFGVSVLGGIGFTMSLFISSLAYKRPEFVPLTRLGVLSGSLISAFVGYCLLAWVSPRGGSKKKDN